LELGAVTNDKKDWVVNISWKPLASRSGVAWHCTKFYNMSTPAKLAFTMPCLDMKCLGALRTQIYDESLAMVTW
jgi:hypothetical protein